MTQEQNDFIIQNCQRLTRKEMIAELGVLMTTLDQFLFKRKLRCKKEIMPTAKTLERYAAIERARLRDADVIAGRYKPNDSDLFDIRVFSDDRLFI